MFKVSERFACRVLGQHRSTQRQTPTGRADEAALTAHIIALVTQYGHGPAASYTELLTLPIADFRPNHLSQML